jgi:two-component system sensor histidine kinase KdpD
VIGIGRAGDGEPLDSEARALFDTLVEQAAAAFDRASLARDMIDARTATETERVRNTLLASVSHDFRTPLSSILGAATSLLDYGDKLAPSAQRDLLTQIKQEAEGLDEMVRNLLAIARIDAGVLELRRDWLDLRDVVDRVVAAARRHGAEQQIVIAWPDDIPLVRADATLTEQAIANVVRNAVGHTPAESRIDIDAAAEADGIVLRVTDNGPGIPADAMPQLFDKFVRGPEPFTHSDGGQGTGLGLAIAKGILEAHGGRITAQSPVVDSHGARFTLMFPREMPPP